MTTQGQSPLAPALELAWLIQIANQCRRPATTEEGFCATLGALMASFGFFAVSSGSVRLFKVAMSAGSRDTHSADLSKDPLAASSISWAYWCPNNRSARDRTARTLRHQCRSVFLCRSVLVPICLGSEVCGYPLDHAAPVHCVWSTADSQRPGHLEQCGPGEWAAFVDAT